MTMHHNPALYQEPRNQPVKTVPLSRESLFSWIENTGRFQTLENDDFQEHKLPDDLDDVLEPEMRILDDEEEPID